MANDVTAEQVVEAAKALNKEEFSRGDLAEQIGVEKPEIRKAFRVARKDGQLEKVRDDDEGTGMFRLTAG